MLKLEGIASSAHLKMAGHAIDANTKHDVTVQLDSAQMLYLGPFVHLQTLVVDSVVQPQEALPVPVRLLHWSPCAY